MCGGFDRILIPSRGRACFAEFIILRSPQCQRTRIPSDANHISTRGMPHHPRRGILSQRSSSGPNRASSAENARSRQARRSGSTVPRLFARNGHTNFVTVNCRTLKSQKSQHLLCQTLNDLNAPVACLQEARLRGVPELDVPPPHRKRMGLQKGIAFIWEMRDRIVPVAAGSPSETTLSRLSPKLALSENE